MNPLIRRPSGLEEILGVYGDPRNSEGRLDQDWMKSQLVVVPFPSKLPLAWDSTTWARTATMHRHVAPFFQAATLQVFDAGLWPEMVSWGGGFTFREQRGASKLSAHAWGIAFDISTKDNPMGSEGLMHPGVIETFENFGFLWGGRFSRPDPMHFQFADNY